MEYIIYLETKLTNRIIQNEFVLEVVVAILNEGKDRGCALIIKNYYIISVLKHKLFCRFDI